MSEPKPNPPTFTRAEATLLLTSAAKEILRELRKLGVSRRDLPTIKQLRKFIARRLRHLSLESYAKAAEWN